MNYFEIRNNIILLKPYLERCYSIYSKFNVASMLVFKTQTKFKLDLKYYGVNVENCSFSLTTCAEKNCITNAITDNANLKEAKYMIVLTNTAKKITPCGSCRQVLSEFFDKDFMIYTIGTNNIIYPYKLGDILPHSFDK